jgi:ATP-dependent exoDNAse (exonuclease V) beta subunit
MQPANLAIPADLDQRRRALDVCGSFIVQAPAGSGKTELLIQRILALLAVATRPEEILAITFTRKAAAEMHKRLLEALETARNGTPPVAAHTAQTFALASAALTRDRALGWNLLDNPTRLQVMTIDSCCAMLVRRMPWLARFGEAPAIAEQPLDLYRSAAEHLLARLERGGEGSAAIECLLAHLDNRLPLLRDLLVAMLGRRDQWLRHLGGVTPDTARPGLESALRRQTVAALAVLRTHLPSNLLAELCTLGSWAAGNLAESGDNHLEPLRDLARLPGVCADDLPAWLAIAHLVLTQGGTVRVRPDKRLGFPADRTLQHAAMKSRCEAVLRQLPDHAPAVEALQALRELPAMVYDAGQWQVLAALIELLPLASLELREVFRSRGQVDFAEIAQGALAALGDDLAPSDLLLHLDSRLRHILVDEFQDTSRGQFELLARLTAGWQEGDGRTLFLVGDPMQSIYRFREAEVGLYLRVRAQGLETVRLTPLTLQANFRSQGKLVDWFNATFAGLFPPQVDEMRGAVPFAAAQPIVAALPAAAVSLTCFAGRDDGAEAAQIIALVHQAQAEQPLGTVAVLVRSRSHLAALIPALKAAGLPWQAQEIDPLSSRPAILDLLALTRALLHPADRVAWLSVLRAPWCGLCLDDLLALGDDDDSRPLWEALTGRGVQLPLWSDLSADGQRRLERVVPVLSRALASKGRVPLRRLVTSTWLGLSGPAGLAAGDLADAEQFFAVLDELDEGGDLVRLEALAERLTGLFAAPDPLAGPTLQLMTIHKAKGLEFDTVILPGLGRAVRSPERALLLWQEQPGPARRDEGLLLAPIPASDRDEQDPTYRAIARIHADKDDLETVRLFYVAATRARRRLHLLGHVVRSRDGELSAAPGSLLKAAWPTLATTTEIHVVDTVADPPVSQERQVMLRRLPLGWLPPSLAPTLAVALPVPRRASVHDHVPATGLSLTLRSEEGRLIGTAVHGWLERFAADGLTPWPVQRLAELHAPLREELLRDGVPLGRVDACVALAVGALAKTLASTRGRWILQAHRDAASELALTGSSDGVPVHAVIDRTFVDEQGVRWVIDYKCSRPREGETVEAFLAGEVERYRAQLQEYCRLMTLRSPQEPVKAAIYLPLLDAWCEVV